jgi:hypothetical protein
MFEWRGASFFETSRERVEAGGKRENPNDKYQMADE